MKFENKQYPDEKEGTIYKFTEATRLTNFPDAKIAKAKLIVNDGSDSPKFQILDTEGMPDDYSLRVMYISWAHFETIEEELDMTYSEILF